MVVLYASMISRNFRFNYWQAMLNCCYALVQCWFSISNTIITFVWITVIMASSRITHKCIIISYWTRSRSTKFMIHIFYLYTTYIHLILNNLITIWESTCSSHVVWYTQPYNPHKLYQYIMLFMFCIFKYFIVTNFFSKIDINLTTV